MLTDTLALLGWTKTGLGRRLGKTPTTVSRWGEEPPKYVVEYLRVALLARKILE